MKVTMRHPDLPEDQTISVCKSAAAVHGAAGWVVVDKPAPAPKTTKTSKAPRRAAETQQEEKE